MRLLIVFFFFVSIALKGQVFQVVITATNAGGSATDTIQITINAAATPVIQTIEVGNVQDSVCVMAFDITLDQTELPDALDFVLKVNGSATGYGVITTAISGNQVSFSVAQPVISTDTLTLDYTQGVEKIRGPTDRLAKPYTGTFSGLGNTYTATLVGGGDLPVELEFDPVALTFSYSGSTNNLLSFSDQAVTNNVATQVADFYVSTSGTGSGIGNLFDPWTIVQLKTELESATPDSGTYALKKGDVFVQKDSIVIDTNPSVGNITITSYGSGALPIVRGAIDVTTDTWTNESGNLWWVSTSSHGSVEAVHLDGAQALLAQHPNGQGNGLVISGTSSGTNVQLTGYDAEDDVDADGGFCAISDNRWTAEYIGITSAINNVITLSSGIGNITVGGSVKLYDFKEGLDSQGEWWYDSGNNRIYIFSTTNPGTTAYSEILISVNDKFAFHIKDADNVTIENLQISHFNIASIQVTGGSNDVIIQNNTLEDNRIWGIYMTSEGAFPGVVDAEILNNTINNCNAGGVYAKSNVDQLTINGNTIDSIGLYYGYGWRSPESKRRPHNR